MHRFEVKQCQAAASIESNISRSRGDSLYLLGHREILENNIEVDRDIEILCSPRTNKALRSSSPCEVSGANTTVFVYIKNKRAFHLH